VGSWIVPGYAQERELGHGASGRVVAAVNVVTGQRVAIKYLADRLFRDPKFLAGFRAEAGLLKSLEVPQVVRLLDYVEAPGMGAAIVMELIDGVSLHQLIARNGPAGPESALAVLKGSLLGLAAAHAAGIVHRDYKPDNVLVDGQGNSKLSDFGIAIRAGRNVPVAGTPLYMAPEQWHGAPATPATDIYAACAVFYECLTGTAPFSGGIGQLRRQHTAEAVPAERVDEPLRPLIVRGMAKDPAARPASALELVGELEATAVAAYGADWETRGRGHLAAGAAALLLLLMRAPGIAASGTGTSSTYTTLNAPRAATKAGARAARGSLSTGKLAIGYGALFAAVFGAVAGGLVLGHYHASSSTTPPGTHPASSSPPASPSPTVSTPPAHVTAQDLLSVPVPASCQHAAGRLVNGTLPGIPANRGAMQLAWLANPRGVSEAAATAFGDLNGDGTGDAATVLDCFAGGVSWPEIIAFYAPGPKLLAWTYITAFNLPGIASQENAFFRRISYTGGAVYAEWATQDEGDAAAVATLDYSATLKLAGGKIIATSLVGVTERQTALAFAGDLRAGDQAAADRLAAPGVGEQAASLFRSYPSALAAAPTCYGLGDAFTMPAPLAALIDPGGPGQVSQGTERLCAFPSTGPGASWVALGMEKTGWRTWQVLWARSA
jgi:tRNA A-37 threonylcarbamoyl transferase component Bud32